MAEDSGYVDDEAPGERITCAGCEKVMIQCYRPGCSYRLAEAAKCVECCPCGAEQAAQLRTAALKTSIRLGV